MMSRKKNAIPVYLSDSTKLKLEVLADAWGTTLSSAVERLVREAKVPKLEVKPLPVLEAGRNIDIQSLKSVPIESRSQLPLTKGVYIVTDAGERVLYVGKASGRNGLRGRWIGRWGHHRDSDVMKAGAKTIKYLELDPSCIAVVEADLIDVLEPLLNDRDENASRSADVSYLQNPEWQVPDEFEYPD